MVKNHEFHTCKPKCLLHYRVLKVLNDSTLLLIMPDRKERKTNVNNVKPCDTTELVENMWDLFWAPLRPNVKINNYNLIPGP